MRRHPGDRVELLRPADISPLAISIVRDHHERLDGLGYPAGIDGEKLHEFPRIAAVADVYDAVTLERVYKAAAPPHVGVRVMVDGHAVLPNVVRHFRTIVFPYPVGRGVVLPDGRVGVVARVDAACPEQPVVRGRLADGSVARRSWPTWPPRSLLDGSFYRRTAGWVGRRGVRQRRPDDRFPSGRKSSAGFATSWVSNLPLDSDDVASAVGVGGSRAEAIDHARRQAHPPYKPAVRR